MKQCCSNCLYYTFLITSRRYRYDHYFVGQLVTCSLGGTPKHAASLNEIAKHESARIKREANPGGEGLRDFNSYDLITWPASAPIYSCKYVTFFTDVF